MNVGMLGRAMNMGTCGLAACLKRCLLLVLLGGMALSAQAQERLAHIFQDNMVLQREKPVPVWGWAKPGTPVEVAFAGQKKQSKSDDNGYWKIVLDPLKADSKGQLLEANIGGTKVGCKDVLVGEVWIATGQSNMLEGGPDQDTGVYPYYVSPSGKGAKPEIRICNYINSKNPANDELRVLELVWTPLKEVSPIAWIGPSQQFARLLRDSMDVPVGIVLQAVGGTLQTAWMERKTLEAFPSTNKKYANSYEEYAAERDAGLVKSSGKFKSNADYDQALTEWLKTKQGDRPAAEFHNMMNFPSRLYNERMFPLAPFAIRGVIWHQGEGGPGGPWDARLVAMVKQWRELFGQDFCFIWGTLARGTDRPPPLNPIKSWFCRSHAAGRTALPLFGADKNVALVELYDSGDDGTHFYQKAEMGRRLGLAALTVAYKQNHIYTGPRMVETKIEGAKARVRFEHVGDGLVYQPSINGISGFFVSGKGDKASKWADVKLIGKNTVEVSHPDIKELESVAYGINSNPHETLFNSAQLSASPFDVNPKIQAVFAYDKECNTPPSAKCRKTSGRLDEYRPCPSWRLCLPERRSRSE